MKQTLRITSNTHSGALMLTWPSGRVEFVDGSFWDLMKFLWQLGRLKYRDGWTLVLVDAQTGEEGPL